MAAVSQTATTLTPPASSHDTGYSWEISVAGHADREKAIHDGKRFVNDDNAYPAAYRSQNGNSTLHNTAKGIDSLSRDYSNGESGSDMKASSYEPTYAPHHHHTESNGQSVREHAGSVDSPNLNGGAHHEQSEDYHSKRRRDITPNSDIDENSKWIHRDKLAKIENEELQAAGIFLPRQRDRARSKSSHRPRRDQSADKLNGSNRSIGGSEHQSRSRKNSTATTLEHRSAETASIPSWDLRRPEEIVEEGDGYWISAGNGKNISRIPVAKTSPVPLPSEHIERDTLLARKRDGSPGAEESITYPKTRTRSGSTGNALAKPASNDNPSPTGKRIDSSPRKPQNAKKKTAANGTAGRPKTRSGPSKDSTSSGAGTTRPTTRSGEREFSASSRQMEGEPPWMVSAYRPDPRLPPDQQLLPTVARRLAQERWEKEGKFGNVYDKDFRPLTDEGFLRPPEQGAATEQDAEKEAEHQQQEEQGGEWPLKAEPRSPSMPGRVNSYSTMPKISDKPTMSPLPSPRTPQPPPIQPAPTVRVPEPPEEPPSKKGGCGCCIVM
ncbi:hypothetical protein QBC44DRAFT_104515 [Cladorrhinum sp. PSN332]|nr:hypothetical protein QBC44DRAFT_104515 [Cladorrhinum sp. PSN332]